MSTCWKCGRKTTEGVTECERCEMGLSPEQLDEGRRMIKEMNENSMPLDWAKVKTLEDLILVVSVLNGGIRIWRAGPLFKTLERFLKEAK
jgi:hypothetical protein